MARTLLAVMALAASLMALAALPGGAAAAPSAKKSIWGPAFVGEQSQFPIYRELGVGIYQASLNWAVIARTRPKDPGDPYDPAYRWPASIDQAVAEAARNGVTVALTIARAPRWANGGRPSQWAPKRPSDFATFARAAARRYPSVHLWLIWGEPTRAANFRPLTAERRDRGLTRSQREAPRLYSRILDAAYGTLKRQSRRNLIIGGNSFTTGDISPRNWIRNLRLPNGRPPRMDLYGHNPFSSRRPNLRRSPLGHGFADYSDLDTLAGWIDSNLGRDSRGRRLRLFLSEFFLPTDHPNHEFNFYVSREIQASWLTSALKIARRWDRIYTLGWLALYDDPPRPRGDEVNRGLITLDGTRKLSFGAYRDG